MLNIVLYQPEIPPNTGNIIRLCANNGFRLHLIEPLGFSLDEKRVRRAGLDYRELATVKHWPTLDDYCAEHGDANLYALTTKARRHYSDASFQAGDSLLFGPETRGLPDEVLNARPASMRLTIPMLENSRSLNLSNSVAIVAYEAWRQLGFAGN
jgi:tRNA (cytidine/uridine-2'-O-)-methyltransferase